MSTNGVQDDDDGPDQNLQVALRHIAVFIYYFVRTLIVANIRTENHLHPSNVVTTPDYSKTQGKPTTQKKYCRARV